MQAKGAFVLVKAPVLCLLRSLTLLFATPVFYQEIYPKLKF